MPTRAPPFLKRLASPGAEAFATIYALESLARANLATVLPLQALKLTGDAQGVSTIFFVVMNDAIVSRRRSAAALPE